MKIKVSKVSGFCWGVERTIDIADKTLEERSAEPVWAIGPVIHNPQVLDRLAQKGLKTVQGVTEITTSRDDNDQGTAIVRTHGVAPEVLDEAKKKGLQIINGTCPYVISSQHVVERLLAEKYSIIIVGEAMHPEITALVAFSKGVAYVVNSVDEVRKLPLRTGRVGILAQTTQKTNHFFEVVQELFNREFQEIRICNTICDDTVERQRSVAKLAEETDLVIVIGGKMSANTKHLVEICESLGGEARHIEHPNEIDPAWFQEKESVGIASGASTADWIVQDVIKRIQEIIKS